jgi:beta-glucosidase
MNMPQEFVWGAATASYQIEGSSSGGCGESIWDRFCRTPGKVRNGDTGDVACDHLNRYKEDVAQMRALGLTGYRFSVSWPRVIPSGTGACNAQGLDFYDSLVDTLLDAGITPYVTLYHWDLPQALQDQGGWEVGDSVAWFADYTRVVVQRLGDRVTNWITHNEPWCVSFLSNLLGVHAPGQTDPVAAFRVAHHVLLSHGAAARVIREEQSGSSVGIALDMNGATPASDDPRDAQAARNLDGFSHRWFLDPVFRGRYPDDMLPYFEDALDGLDLDRVREAAAPLDFFGLNFYRRDNYRWDESNPIKAALVPTPDVQRTAMGWEVHPQSLTEILMRLKRDYNPPPIYITENGAAYDDPAPVDGIVEDPQRVEYLRRHIAAVEDATAQGVDVAGYFVWSLLDNFEWAEGYAKRFGIVHVDFETLQRTPKRSAQFYRDYIRASRERRERAAGS